MRSTKSLIIVALIAIALTISVGYASLTTDLSMKNNSQQGTIDWNVKIVKVETTSVSGAAKALSPSFDQNSATFSPELYQDGDSVTYTITIVNDGNISARLDNVNLSEQGEAVAPEIIYSNTTPSLTLAPGETTTMTVTVGYNSLYTDPTVLSDTSKTIKNTITYVKAE